jgi:acyl phosphate:glycerol-3-phosphate acyltransferase
MSVLMPILLIVGAYFVGAIPFGLIVAKSVAGVDVREKGSGNIGATNVARSAGKKLGVITLILDAAKGAAPVIVGQYLLEQPLDVVCGAGLASVIGHIFPIYLLFRGGKGVATGLGVFVAAAPISTAVAAGVFVAVYAVGRIVSLASLAACLVLIGAVALLDGRREILYLAIVVVALVVMRHKGNIERLLKRSEHRV